MRAGLHARAKAAPVLAFTSRPPARVLQRKCACGGTPGPSGECEACRKKRVQRKIDNRGANASIVPPIVHEVLRSPGHTLDPATRAFMEARFGHNFGRVRLHTDTRAGESASAVDAQAYTVGENIVFGRNEYIPASGQGRRLIAHELAHTVQQTATAPRLGSLQIASEADPAEREAELIANRTEMANGSAPLTAQPNANLRRKIKVDKPADKIPNPGGKGLDQTNAVTAKSYLNTLCAGGAPTVDAASGEVGIAASFCTEGVLAKMGLSPSPASAGAQSFLKTATGCGCICDLVQSVNEWKITIDDKDWPHTNFTDEAAAKGKSATLGGSGGVVTAPSPNSTKAWGAATASGKALDIDPWLVLGHELCGHAWLGNSGLAAVDELSPRGEGGHQETVARENELRKEHGIELRGTFKQPNCGGSYWRDKGAPGKVNWSDFRKVCQAWRADYNKKNKTAYKITDTIP